MHARLARRGPWRGGEGRGGGERGGLDWENTHTPTPKQTKKITFLPLSELTKKPVDGFSAGLVGDSLFEWAITVMGPPDTF